VPDGCFDQFDGQRNCGLELFVPRPKLGILEPQGVALLMQAIPRLSGRRDREVGNMLGHIGVPLGQFLIAAIEAQAQGEADWTTYRHPRDRVMSQGKGAITVVIVPVHVVEEAS
jgi:hypothetical protein